MQGSQIDFLRQLVDTMPHITVEDERRSVPTQPAEQEYGGGPDVRYRQCRQTSRHQISGVGDELAALLDTRRRGSLGDDHRDHQSRRRAHRHHLDRHRPPPRDSGLETRARKCARASSTTFHARRTASSSARRWPKSSALKTGNTVLLVGGQGIQLNSTVTGLFRSGLKRIDESQIYSLIGPAQVMMGQSGVVNQLRLRLNDPDVGAKGRRPGRSADRLQIGVLAGSQCRPAVDLLPCAISSCSP